MPMKLPQGKQLSIIIYFIFICFISLTLSYCIARITNWKKECIMHVKVIHSVALRQSAVQLFVGNELKIVSHIVGIDTIGFEDIGLFNTANVMKRYK